MNVQLAVLASENRKALTERLRSRKCARVSGRAAELLALFDAQLGEIGWHSTHVDETIDDMSDAHANRIIELARSAQISNPRILELGAYAHHSAQIAASTLEGSAVSHDISAASLEVGRVRAEERGYHADHSGVAGDFHSLPFEDGAFDITFIASAVHHTWRPWQVMSEMVRVTRPGGIVHLENEPVGRAACLYHYRGNRPEEFTDFERRLDAAGLTHTVTSPFPGSRAEKLFGMIENDRFPIEVYERALLTAGEVLEWRLDAGALVHEFERWLIVERPGAEQIARRILSGVAQASEAFTEIDEACGLSPPGPDDVWPLAYRLETVLTELDATNDRDIAAVFGAALRASIRKSGDGRVARQVFNRKLRQVGEVLIDDEVAQKNRVDFSNVLPDPQDGDFGPNWYIMLEESGHYTLANMGADCNLPIDEGEGFLILRAYSAAAKEPYFFSVMRNGELVYSHCVARAESHLTKIYIQKGDRVMIHHHNYEGEPVEVQFHSRLIPRFVPVA